MDFAKVLAELREELQALDTAIESLERVQRGGKRRGRPPVWLSGEKSRSQPANRKPRKRPPADEE